jgi:hypothetical protein
MMKIGLKSGLVAVALASALPGAMSWAQSAADYQTLASSQFSEPRALGNDLSRSSLSRPARCRPRWPIPMRTAAS